MKLTPLNKGVTSHSDELELLMCDMIPTPGILLTTIHCNCKTGFSGNCFSSRIYLLSYSSACGSCQDTDFDN